MRHILSNLWQDSPQLSLKLKQQSELTHFKNTFLTSLEREQILFIVPKGERLLFAFKHKALCVEFNRYKQKQIIQNLKQHSALFPSLSTIQSIHAYVPTHILAQNIPQAIPSIQRFYEHSNGNFENKATDPLIHEKFEALRLGIKRQLEVQNAR